MRKKSILAVVVGVLFVVIVTTLVDVVLHLVGVFPGKNQRLTDSLAATWGKGLGPTWYPIALVVLAIPQCWAGGKLYEAFSARR